MTVTEYAVRTKKQVIRRFTTREAAENASRTYSSPPWAEKTEVVQREVGPWRPVLSESPKETR